MQADQIEITRIPAGQVRRYEPLFYYWDGSITRAERHFGTEDEAVRYVVDTLAADRVGENRLVHGIVCEVRDVAQVVLLDAPELADARALVHSCRVAFQEASRAHERVQQETAYGTKPGTEETYERSLQGARDARQALYEAEEAHEKARRHARWVEGQKARAAHKAAVMASPDVPLPHETPAEAAARLGDRHILWAEKDGPQEGDLIQKVERRGSARSYALYRHPTMERVLEAISQAEFYRAIEEQGLTDVPTWQDRGGAWGLVRGTDAAQERNTKGGGR